MVDLLVEALDAERRAWTGRPPPARSGPRRRSSRCDERVDLAARALAHQHVDRPLALEELGHQVPADEAGGAGDEVVQGPSTRPIDSARRVYPAVDAVTAAGAPGRTSLPTDARPVRRHALDGYAASQADAVDRHLTLKQAAERVGVSPATLKRWAESGVIPNVNGSRAWTPRRSPHARIVARLRERGHSPRADPRGQPSRAGSPTASSRSCSPTSERPRTLDDAAEATGLEPALIERFWTGIGLPAGGPRAHDRRGHPGAASTWRRCSPPGFPLVAFLQLCRVYGQALSQIADAEVRLFHIYVHEPLMREGVPGLADGRGDGGPRARPAAALLAADGLRAPALPAALRRAGRGRPHGDGPRSEDVDLGRVRVAIAFADLAGYTRFTEEEGEEEALSSSSASWRA